MRHRTLLGVSLFALSPWACSDPSAATGTPPGHAGAGAAPIDVTGGAAGTASNAGGSPSGGAAGMPDTGGAAGGAGGAGTLPDDGGSADSGRVDPLDGKEQVVLHVDFEKQPPGTYTAAMALGDFGAGVGNPKVPEGRAEIVVDPDSGSKALKVKYPKGCVGTDACAIQFRVVLSRSMETAFIRYRVKFDANFEWVKGGKLPGLCGGECNTGCISVSGSDGWSARMMWRGGGELVQYMYYPGKKSSCGDDLPWNRMAMRGRWLTVKTMVTLNSPGQSNGIVRSWLDGEQVLNTQDFRYRNVDSVKIDRFYFSTFYGGKGGEWAPGSDTYISYDDFVITTVDPDQL